MWKMTKDEQFLKGLQIRPDADLLARLEHADLCYIGAERARQLSDKGAQRLAADIMRGCAEEEAETQAVTYSVWLRRGFTEQELYQAFTQLNDFLAAGVEHVSFRVMSGDPV